MNIKDWMHVAKDLPSSDFTTVISGEWNLHRPDHCDPDDLMFVCGGPVCFLSPVKLWQDGHSSSTLFGGTYCGKESREESNSRKASCKASCKASRKASQKGCQEGCKEEVVF